MTQADLPACVWTDAGCLKGCGLGEPFGKASLTNTAFVLSIFVPMRDRSSLFLEGQLGYPSDAWPDEALERGLSRPLAKRRKNWKRNYC